MFSEAIVSFSVGGRHFQDEPIRFAYTADHIFETSRNVTVQLHHRIGKWVRIELRFAARWILLSEVVFESGETKTKIFLFMLLGLMSLGNLQLG